MSGNRWGPIEWVMMALPFVVPGALVVVALARNGFFRRGMSIPSRLQAAGLAVLGFVVGCFLIGTMVTHSYFSARAASRYTSCLSNLRQVSTALALYAQDWNDRLPPAASWAEGVSRYQPPDERLHSFRCPSANTPFAFGLNGQLAGIAQERIADPQRTLMLTETDTMVPSGIASPHSFPVPQRHTDSSNAASRTATCAG